MVAHAVIGFHNQRMVVAVGAAEDISHRTVLIDDTAGEQRGSVSGASQRASAVHGVSEGLGRRRNIDVCEVRQFTSETAEIAHSQHGVPAQITFHNQIELMDLGVLEVLVKEYCIWFRRAAYRRGCQKRRESRRGGCRSKGERRLRSRQHYWVGQSLEDDGFNKAAIKDAITPTHIRLA